MLITLQSINQSIHERQYVGWSCPDHPSQRLLGLKGLICILNITLGTYNVRRLKNSNEFTGLFKISVS